jgi:hypothetical protein
LGTAYGIGVSYSSFVGFFGVTFLALGFGYYTFLIKGFYLLYFDLFLFNFSSEPRYFILSTCANYYAFSYESKD